MGYLVISLKVGERVKIGETEILISDVDGKRVDVAIDAPKTEKITRLKWRFEESGFKNGDQSKPIG